jgi:hypothetical protein
LAAKKEKFPDIIFVTMYDGMVDTMYTEDEQNALMNGDIVGVYKFVKSGKVKKGKTEVQ